MPPPTKGECTDEEGEMKEIIEKRSSMKSTVKAWHKPIDIILKLDRIRDWR